MKEKTLAIELKNLYLNYTDAKEQTLTILDNISAKVQKGESVSIVGPSGAGKTSLLMLMAGVEKPKAGSIKIAGKEISNLDEDQLAKFRKKNVGVVFQNFHLIPTMTALENVSLALELAGKTKNSEKEALKSLEMVGLSNRASHYPEQLSGGEQQRVAIARAFATKPKILLADEPTGNLDEENSDNIINLLFGLKKEFNTTLILITHDSTLASKTTRKFIIKDHKLHDKK